MRKLDRSVSKQYRPLVLWPDNIHAITEVLANCRDTKITADDIEYDSASEFLTQSAGRSPKSISISAREPHLSIDLHSSSARVYVSSSELVAAGIFAKVNTILETCERKPRLFYRFLAAWLASVTLPYIFYLPQLKPYSSMSLLVSILILVWMLILGYVHFWRYAVIYTVRPEERRTFFRRNVDAIVVAVVSALLGAVAGAFATKVADKYWPSSITTPTSSGPQK